MQEAPTAATATADRPQSVVSSDEGVDDSRNVIDADAGGANDRWAIFHSLTRFKSLDRALEKPHITGITVCGTVGVGLFVGTGKVITLGGALGATLAILLSGLMITCVMLCLSEMVSFRHEAGAIFEFPKLFVSHSLGFAVGVIYWLSYTTGLVTLIVSAAQLLELDNRGTAGAMAGIIVVITFANMLGGVRLYGNLEWIFKWFKILVILALWVIMLYINVSEGIGSKLWYSKYLFPPGLNGNFYQGPVPNENATYSEILSQDNIFGPGSVEIGGAGGIILGVISAINSSMFSFIGVEILIVAAGEARRPRRDLPSATSQMYIVTIFLYLVSTIIVSFNVGYDDPHLESLAGNTATLTSSNSPFIIAMKRSRISPVFASLFKAFFFVSAATTANTNVYVSSRTLFALTSNSNVHWVEQHIGHTSYGKTPMWAIGVSLLPSLFALTAISYQSGTDVINCFSEIATVSFLCVYAAECWTFIKYMEGLGSKRDGPSYAKICQRIPKQPFFAWVGLITTIFFALVNGWYHFYQISQGSLWWEVLVGLIGSYTGPLLFFLLWLGYKITNRMPEEREENFWALRWKRKDEEEERRRGGVPMYDVGRTDGVLVGERGDIGVQRDEEGDFVMGDLKQPVKRSIWREIWMYT